MPHKKELLPAPPITEEEMRKTVRHMVRAEMARRGLGFKDLRRALERMGVTEDERVLSNKIARGSFSAAFLLQCCWAMNISRFDTGFASFEATLDEDWSKTADLDEPFQKS